MVRPQVTRLAVFIVLLAACTNEPVRVGDAPRAYLSSGANFLRPAPNAPSLAQTNISFYAVRGQSRQVRMMYHARPGASDSTEFLRFEVPSQSLARRPDGTAVADGDSVLITLTVTDSVRLIVKFEPGGLGFDPLTPARLAMSYAETHDDIDNDGDVDTADEMLESLFQIWRQEHIGDPFVALVSLLDKTREVVRASVTGFTNYAISY